MNIGIILASGSGERFGGETPKQFFKINGNPIIYYSMKSFYYATNINKTIIVISDKYNKDIQDLIKNKFNKKNIHCSNIDDFFILCEGGKSRQHSLYNGVKKSLELYKDNHKIVSHCAARPIIPTNIIEKNISILNNNICVNTVRKIHDTVLYDKNFLDRNKLYIGLTPQSFYAYDYIKAFEITNNVDRFTCACSLMKYVGYDMKLLITEELIYKITTMKDLDIIREGLNYVK